MSFDPENEPLSTSIDLSQEAGFTESELVAAGLFHALKDWEAATWPLTHNGLTVTYLNSRNAYHLHAPPLHKRPPINYVVAAHDLWPWCFRVAKEMWTKGYYRMPSGA